MKVLIVGGVAAGASAAARLRRLDEFAEIIMYERGPHISFANCGLPYYVGGVIKERDDLLLQTPDAMNARFNIDVRVNSEVVAVDSVKKTVTVCSNGNFHQESYDTLVLSPGARPSVPPIPGIENPWIIRVRSVNDADQLKAKTVGAKSAVVIGGGYIGVETAENLAHLGLDVSIVEAAPHIMAPFDEDMAPLLENELQEHGIRLVLNTGVAAFKENGCGIGITLTNGSELSADLCILAVGITPDTAWLQDSGVELDARGYILVDKRMRTNIEHIYAAGDAVSVNNLVTGEPTAIPLAGPANRQGRIIADNIAGITSEYMGTLGTSIIKVFGLAAGATGSNERVLQAAGIEYKIVFLHPMNHAKYYPGAVKQHVKLLYSLDGKVLGAQAIGMDGIDKVIDVIATAMRFGATIYDLTELELAYAPAYLSAKSPANFAGFIACNEMSGLLEHISPLDVDHSGPDTVVLDVRRVDEFEKGTIEGSIHIPLNELRRRVNELEPCREKIILVLCEVGLRGYIAYRFLRQKGFKVKNVSGGYLSYRSARFVPKGLKECLRAG